MSRVILAVLLTLALQWALRRAWGRWRAYGSGPDPIMRQREYWS